MGSRGRWGGRLLPAYSLSARSARKLVEHRLSARLDEWLDGNVGAAEHPRIAGRHFTGDSFVESRQTLCGFILHNGPQHDRELVNLPVKSLGLEERAAELGQASEVELLERVDAKQPIEEAARFGPRVVDAELLVTTAFRGRTARTSDPGPRQ